MLELKCFGVVLVFTLLCRIVFGNPFDKSQRHESENTSKE